MKLEFSRRIFRKILEYPRSWKTVQWEPSYSMRTDTTKPIVASRNFANTSENIVHLLRVQIKKKEADIGETESIPSFEPNFSTNLKTYSFRTATMLLPQGVIIDTMDTNLCLQTYCSYPWQSSLEWSYKLLQRGVGPVCVHFWDCKLSPWSRVYFNFQ